MASGVVVPAQQVKLGLPSLAQVGSVEVQPGQTVKAGQVLISLAGGEAWEAAVTAAEMELLNAQQALDEIYLQADQLRARTRLDLVHAQEALRIAERKVELASDSSTEYTKARLEAEYLLAEAEVALLEQRLEKMSRGPNSDLLAVAQARLDLAEAQLEAAKAQAASGEVRAPFDGTIAEISVNPGETVMPGQALVVISDLEHLQVETIDLSERSIDQVSLGKSATIFIEPLGIEVRGQVAQIAPMANTLGGDVVYRVILTLDEQPEGLRWGMSVEVEIEVD